MHTKSFWSEVLRRRVRTRVTASVLRTMDKMGGFDEYILRTRPDKLDSQFAEDLRSLMNKVQRSRAEKASSSSSSSR